MSWKDVDLFLLESDEFSTALNEVIAPLFTEGHATLKRWDEKRKASLIHLLEASEEEEDEKGFAYFVSDREEWLNIQREQVLGAIGLHYLHESLKCGLEGLCRYFNQTHPRSRGDKYPGKYPLACLRNEYLDRFQFDFQTMPCFDSLEELSLARNAGIHPGRGTLKAYTDNVANPRFCKDGEFRVPAESYFEILGEIDRFYRAVVRDLGLIRKAQFEAAKPRPEQNN